MRDIHCHILPGVDDGARDMAESLAMLEAAKRAGVTSIVCTPHCRRPYFDYEAMWESFRDLKAHAGGFPLTMGFEVNWDALMELGLDDWAPYLGIQGPSFCGDGAQTFLLELSSGAPRSQFGSYQETVWQLQGMGYDVVIAHPERYRAIQDDLSLAEDFRRAGCKLQASCDFVAGGRLGHEKRPARRLFERGMYDYIASDAHRVEHYELLAKAVARFGVGTDGAGDAEKAALDAGWTQELGAAGYRVPLARRAASAVPVVDFGFDDDDRDAQDGVGAEYSSTTQDKAAKAMGDFGVVAPKPKHFKR